MTMITADIRRLGIKTTGRTRPIRIQWKEEQDKETFMSSLKNLRDCDHKFQQIEVQHDLTPEQSKLVREAKKKAKEMTEEALSTGFLYRTVIQQSPNWEVRIQKMRAQENKIQTIKKRIEEEKQKAKQQETKKEETGNAEGGTN
jgi:hypothetical protein